MTKVNKQYPGVFVDNNGKFFYQTELGVDPISGKRITRKSRKTEAGKPFRNPKEAYKELMRVKVEFDRLYSHDNYNMTFEQFMNEIFLPAYKVRVDETSTYQTALPRYKKFIRRFGKMRLRDITPRDCELFRLDIIQRYSPNYARDLWCGFKQSLGYAERLGYISYLPCKSLENPKGKHSDTKFWRKEEFLKVIDTFDLTDYHETMKHALTWCCFMWGTRVGEVLALKWKDVLFEKRAVFIHSTLVRGKDGLYAKEGTKTHDGKRIIDCDRITIEVLNRWRRIQVASDDEDYVFSFFGTALDKSVFSRMLKTHAKMAGVPEITGNGLRHSNNTYLRRELDKSSELVSMRSGRKPNSKVTDEVYVDFYKTKSDYIADEMVENLLKTALPRTLPTSILKD